MTRVRGVYYTTRPPTARTAARRTNLAAALLAVAITAPATWVTTHAIEGSPRAIAEKAMGQDDRDQVHAVRLLFLANATNAKLLYQVAQQTSRPAAEHAKIALDALDRIRRTGK